ncbi:MAG: AMP-binding protein [Acidobacteriota bacterium]
MRRDTLIDVFADLAATRGEFLAYDDGFRLRTWTYGQTAQASLAFAARLRDHAIAKGDRIVLWSENRPEWVAAFWGAIVGGVILVPVDFRSSPEFVRRVCGIVSAKAVLVGDDVPGLPDASDGDNSGRKHPVWRISALDWQQAAPFCTPGVESGDTAEIIFTSGATADPKGVVLTHRNILANLVPVEREILKYRRWGRPFFPLRFLNLLPLSHMFGQSMATFIPPLLPGTTIFMRSYTPRDVVRQIRRRRVSVLVSVPKILEVLRDYVAIAAPSASPHPSGRGHWLRRWWRHRDAHRLFGLKFWCFVVGGAPLDPELEAFWSALGFLVVQGYGLTETAPIVTLNHPFAARRGSVGKPIAGLSVKVASDGEILVRGDNVMQGYFNAPEATAAAFEDGWLRTGDIGEVDASGRLYVRGRKKEMIVTPDGLNVFPDDVERVLNQVPGVRESAVVGLADGAAEHVHAVLVLDEGTTADDVVRLANQRLGDAQRIRSASTWPGEHLPRTEGTRKVKRVEIGKWAAGQLPPGPIGTERDDPLAGLLARYAPGRRIGAETTLEELGLSSLERIELMVAIEQRFQTSIDESAFGSARTLGDLQGLAASPGPARIQNDRLVFPVWSRSSWARLVRRFLTPGLVLPLTRLFARLRVAGAERLHGIEGPVIFAANHQSHLDTPVLLAALPVRFRNHLAPAMAKEFFAAHFAPAGFTRRERWTSGLLYRLAALCFNAFPLPQRGAGARRTLGYAGELAEAGYSILVFPEGRRTASGEIHPFQAGVGMMAVRLGLPIVPVRLEGAHRVLHASWRWPKIGTVGVAFGQPIRPHGHDYAALAREVEEAVRRLEANGPALA